jgi:SAM-dependent methyltransferase
VEREPIVRQLRRQSSWLGESYRYILTSNGITGRGRRPTALDIGCGPGFVMEGLSGLLDVRGLDSDPDMVGMCRVRGLTTIEGDANHLPFEDGSFDMVYCSFLLMWLERPAEALREMARVSRRWIVCLAEPDLGARIDHPEELGVVRDLAVEGLRRQGADPLVGRKLRALFREAALHAEVGCHSGVWSAERLRQEFEDEWAWVLGASEGAERKGLDAVKKAWRRAVDDGTIFQYNPIFYVVGEK